MKRFCILLIFSLTSCSVKKNIAKDVEKEHIKTEIITTTTTSISDSINIDSNVYEIVVEQQDSLKPIEINLNGVKQTFHNAKRVSLIKTSKSLKQAKNTIKTHDSISNVDSIVEKNTLTKQIEKKSNYNYIIIIIFIIIILSIRKYIKLYI